MSSFHDFLVEHAKFPFPPMDTSRSINTTDISLIEVGMLQKEWKAKCAIRDGLLAQKLCDGLKKIPGDKTLSFRGKQSLLSRFSPKLQSSNEDEFRGEDSVWSTNENEAESLMMINTGIRAAARDCLFTIGRHHFEVKQENKVEGGTSRVDSLSLVDKKKVALCEAKSPSVMSCLSDLLPERGIILTWTRGQPLMPKILTKAALYLGLRRLEWLFITCHNLWVICRLVRDDDHPFLAYSPMISIQDSSEPFRAFLGALLSGQKDADIEDSTFEPDIQLDDVIKEADEGPRPEDAIDDGSGAYSSSSRTDSATQPLMTRSCARARATGCDNAEFGIMITSSSPSLPKSCQVWVHLQALSNNTLCLPVGPIPGRNARQHLWLTRFIGSGSTGNVWRGRFNNSDDSESFAIKIVESDHPSDTDRQQRLLNEFKVYLKIESAYQSGQLRDRITPRCYGAFGGDGVSIIILDLCDGILNRWDELSASELAQVYKLVQDLHGIGITHGDIEPRNVMRAPGGGFHLINFSESRKHTCNDDMVLNNMVESHHGIHALEKMICSELQMLRTRLWKRRPLQPHNVTLPSEVF